MEKLIVSQLEHKKLPVQSEQVKSLRTEFNGRIYKVPFKTPSDYYIDLLGSDASKINDLTDLSEKRGWTGKYDSDLHIYPYVHAVPSALSLGCAQTCYFCPTAMVHQGNKYYANPDIVIPKLQDKNVHFMDEDFFDHPNMSDVLPELKKNKIIWSCMTTNSRIKKALDQFGENELYDSGLRLVELGLENVSLMNKVKKETKTNKVALYYLNMTCLPKETKETIRENAEWMKERSLKDPIHYNNGVWYAPGQFYFPYNNDNKGRMLDGETARTRPTFIPDSLLEQDFKITNLSKANYYSQLVYDFKMYPKKMYGNIGEFIGTDAQKALWLIQGLRTNNIS